jgi:hypothetical protein
LSSPYQSHYAIPEWAYFTSAFIELTIAIALAFRAWAALRTHPAGNGELF